MKSSIKFFIHFNLLICGIIFNNKVGGQTISSFSPTSGPIGTTVTITGTNFSSTPTDNIVFFGATQATVTTATTTQLSVTVPAGATYQPISVLVNGLTAYSNAPFVVTFPGGGTIDASSFAIGSYPTNYNPRPSSVTIADLDGDGRPDVVVANHDSYFGTISIFKNTSTTQGITFASKIDLSAGPYPTCVAIGDLDGDGRPDLAVANDPQSVEPGTISVFKNTSTPGSISFANRVGFIAGLKSTSVAIADLNGDGRPDLVATGLNSYFAGAVFIYKNIGTTGIISAGTLAGEIDIVAGNPAQVSVADIDGDSKPDLVVVGGGTVSIYRNGNPNYSSGFYDKVDFKTAPEANMVAIGDMDGDGKPDIAIAGDETIPISVFRNISTVGEISGGSFANKVDVAANQRRSAIAIADIDGDGKPDLAATNYNYPGTISIFKNSTGDISPNLFANPSDFAAGGEGATALSVALADLNGDGRAELISSGGNILRNLVAVPRIDSFFPAYGPSGTTIAIKGAYFDPSPANNLVEFNSVATIVTTSSTTGISATVPIGATTGPITITVNGTVGTSSSNFLVTNIASFSPTSGTFGTTVTISGIGFDTTPINNLVTFNGTPASVVASTDKTLTVTVPDGASSGIIMVTANGVTSQSPFAYTVTMPKITSFSPKFGPIGTVVTIAGINFDIVPVNNTVAFNGVASTSTASTSTSISTVVPAGATTGPVSVKLGDVTATSSVNFLITNIASVSPSFGTWGTTVIIAGIGFDSTPANNLVTFNGTPANITASTDTTITVKVPDGASTGVITVIANGVTSQSPAEFTVTPSRITSFSPASGPVGSTVNISGTSFDPTPGNNIVFFGATKAIVTSATATQLKVTVPAGATFQPISVTAHGLTSYSNAPFVVTFPSSRVIDSTLFAHEVNIILKGRASSPNAVAISDLDEDGKPDLITRNATTLSILKNISTVGLITPSSFASSADFGGATNSFSGKIAIGDLNGDGKPDVAVANTNSITIFKNATSSEQINTNSFAAVLDMTAAGHPGDVSIGDLDGDGKPDLAVVTVVADTVIISVFKNTSSTGASATISFAPRVNFVVDYPVIYYPGHLDTFYPDEIDIRDLNGDGKPEVIASYTRSYYGSCSICGGYNNDIVIFENRSLTGSLTRSSFASVRFATGRRLAIGDLDGDGQPDLATTFDFIPLEFYYQTSLSVLRNTSTATLNLFSSQIGIYDSPRSDNDYATGVAMGDLDGDGKVELVVPWSYLTLSVFKNTSAMGTITANSFAPKVDFITRTTPQNSGNVAVGDLDGDGRPDLAVANHNGNAISILRNTIPESVTEISNERSEIFVYPIPAREQLIVAGVSRNSESLSVYSMLGKELHPPIEFTQDGAIINIKEFSSGMYILRVNDGKDFFCQKFIKE